MTVEAGPRIRTAHQYVAVASSVTRGGVACGPYRRYEDAVRTAQALTNLGYASAEVLPLERLASIQRP